METDDDPRQNGARADTDSDPHDVARYLAIDELREPTFTPDGQLLFRGDTTGTHQVWTVDEPGGWPRRLTPHEQRVSTVAASPTREAFVFGMDTGGDERDQLHYYDLTTGRERALTDEPTAKHAWGGWGPDGETIFFTANRREAGRFDVYSLDVTGAAGDASLQSGDATPQLELAGPGGWLHVGAVGPDGDRLALLEPRAGDDVRLSIFDRERDTRQSFGSDAPARYHSPAFDGDAGLYCVTDEGADTAFVGRFDLDTGELTRVAGFDDGSGGPTTDAWSVDALAHHETGALAFCRNVGGYSVLHRGRVEDGTFTQTARVETDGVVSDLTFDADGERLAATHTSPTEPYGVVVYDDESAAGADTVTGERWTPVGTCGLPAETFHAPETIHYETFDGRDIPAYWTLPDDTADDVPVIVDVHGGPEHQRRPWFAPTKQFFLNQGYAVLEPNVRGSSGYGDSYAALDDVDRRMDAIRDVRQAVGWLADHPRVDEDRVVAYGRSYGGFVVLSAITEYPDLWAAAVEFVGIADFETFLENTGDWRRGHREAEYGSLADDRDLLREISPLGQIDRVACPLFVQHGANDPRVPVSEARQVIDAAREQGVPVESLIFEEEGHHTTSRANLIEQFERVAGFLAKHV